MCTDSESMAVSSLVGNWQTIHKRTLFPSQTLMTKTIHIMEFQIVQKVEVRKISNLKDLIKILHFCFTCIIKCCAITQEREIRITIPDEELAELLLTASPYS